jgi:uncharacterized protein YpmS
MVNEKMKFKILSKLNSFKWYFLSIIALIMMCFIGFVNRIGRK